MNIDRDKIIDYLSRKYPIYDLIKFDEFSLSQKLKENPYLVMKYQDLYLKEKQKLDILQEKYEEVCGTKYHFYRFENDEELTKTEIEKYYLPNDSDVKKHKKLLQIQRIKVEFFKLCATSLDRQY
jgi:hypothetical protein